MKEYIINPAYYLRKDGNRVLLCSREDEKEELHSQEWSSFIHPLTAQMLSFFDGINSLEDIAKKVALTFGLGLNQAAQILQIYIERDKSFIVRNKDGCSIFPKNLIIRKDNIKDFYIYSSKEFPFEGKPDLKTFRLCVPISLNLQLTMKCYTDCCYCYANRRLSNDNLMNIEQIYSIIHQAKELGMLSFDINGGEVIMHPHFREIISEIIKCGFQPLISTKIPINKDLIFFFRKIGLKNLQISLDSADIEVLKKTIRVDNSYLLNMAKTLENITSAQMPLNINVVITKYNSTIKQMDDLIAFLAQFSCVKKVQMSPEGYSLYKPQNFKPLRPANGFVDELEKHLEFYRKMHSAIEFNLSGNDWKEDYDLSTKEKEFNKRAICTANLRNLVILPDGRVTICEELYEHPKFIIGDLTQQSILEVWNSDKAKKIYFRQRDFLSKESICQKCEDFDSCKLYEGSCWKLVLMAYGNENWDYPDPRCPKAPFPYNEIWLEH